MARCAGRRRLLRQRGDELIPDRYVRRSLASWYGDAFDGKPTASGEPFDSNQFTTAHYDLPFDSRVRVRNLNNDRGVELRVNDRVPLEALGLAAGRRRVDGAARHARWRAGVLWGARRDCPERRGRRCVRVRDQPARPRYWTPAHHEPPCWASKTAVSFNLTIPARRRG